MILTQREVRRSEHAQRVAVRCQLAETQTRAHGNGDGRARGVSQASTLRALLLVHAHKNPDLGKDVLGSLVKTGRLALAFA